MAETNKQLLQADGRNRAFRSFIQNITIDVGAALVLYLLPVFQNATGWQDLDLKIMGFMVTKTVVVSAFSYLMRTVLDGSKVPTPLPPAPVAEPADDDPLGVDNPPADPPAGI